MNCGLCPQKFTVCLELIRQRRLKHEAGIFASKHNTYSPPGRQFAKMNTGGEVLNTKLFHNSFEVAGSNWPQINHH
jgi:hypothetical protein